MPKFDRMIVLFCKPTVRASGVLYSKITPDISRCQKGVLSPPTAVTLPHMWGGFVISACHTLLTIGLLPFCATGRDKGECMEMTIR
jgi:hypothetical protein